jgi:murein DD-endopeptidase MepM/ murein hydrolase activator NlpD
VRSKKAQVAYGGYLEQRNIYKRSTYFNQQVNPNDERNIHLGIDIWAPAGTKVLAAWDGELHSFQNNTNHGDYGPTIILKHVIDGFTFYTLYGHLSLNSISTLCVGNQIAQGEVIAFLGDSVVNGDYAPHLHFQIILDIQDYFGDYPGVCSVNQLEFYKSNCPDPNLLLGLGNG